MLTNVTSPVAKSSMTSSDTSRLTSRYPQAGDLPHFSSLVYNRVAAPGGGPSQYAGAPGVSLHRNYADIHPCRGVARARYGQSGRSVLRSVLGTLPPGWFQGTPRLLVVSPAIARSVKLVNVSGRVSVRYCCGRGRNGMPSCFTARTATDIRQCRV